MAITIEKLPDSEQEYYEGRNELKTSLDLIVSMINDTKSELSTWTKNAIRNI
ncbi:hypothetical protein N752_18290 [Desulforamulus aquiferis]|nr:hypothetical protein [Desulforamulus aquiferis]RYD03698.1 hypothetical protein N752_18290 [Desulforamulus aquiferis]